MGTNNGIMPYRKEKKNIATNLAIFVKKVKTKRRKNWDKKNKIAVMNHESWHLGGKQR